MYNHDEKLDKNRLRLVTFISFLIGFSEAVVAYVFSSYFKEASGTENVGTFYVVSYFVALVMLLNFHKVVRKLGKSNVFYFSVLTKIVVLLALVMLDPSRAGMLLVMLYLVATVLEWVSLDIIIESFSSDNLSGRIRGLHLTILNAGFIFGPFVFAYIMDHIGFHGVFVFSLIFNCFVLIFGLIGLRQVNHRFKQDLKISEVIAKVIRRKNVMRIYYIAFILDFFYALMVIYTPIYLRDLGYSWEDIGKIFTVMLIPFVLLEYPMGILADRKTGEKEFLIFSLFVMGSSTLAIYFLNPAGVTAWMGILFVTRIGAALVEILRDSYFYKRIDGHDVDVINFFRTAGSAGNIVAAAIASLLVYFMPDLKFIFILNGVVVLTALYPAIKLVDNKCETEVATNC